MTRNSIPVPGPSPLRVPAGTSTPKAQSKACYNCRRRRLRCDRSVPSCRKCSTSGEQCLGYGTVLRWANAPAVRGKLAAPMHVARERNSACVLTEHGTPSFVNRALLDPFLNGLGRRARHYVHHFTTTVCRDLVSVDQPNHNPFRTIVPLASNFSFLSAIVIATGAMHLAALNSYQNHPTRPELIDALAAKDKAIRLLRSALADHRDITPPQTRAVLLAATVFFINIDLIDSGKGGWQAHMEAAIALMSNLHSGSSNLNALSPSLVSLVDAIAADCLTYCVLGSIISGVVPETWVQQDLAARGLFSILRRAEPYSYHCCPPEILQINLAASGLYGIDAVEARAEAAAALLRQAREFCITQWVHGIRGLAPDDDLDVRVSLASAHRAAACLYILLAVPEVTISDFSPEMLVQEVIEHLAMVSIEHVLVKGTVWPTFMAGAQTDDLQLRKWCLDRMQALGAKNPWMCPWGYIRTAIQVLQHLWAARDAVPEREPKISWLREIKAMRDKCLIV